MARPMCRQPSLAGQSLTELALMLPMLILLVVGTLDVGRLADAYVVMTNAAREATRYGATYPTNTTGIKNRAIAEAANSGYALTAANISDPVIADDGTCPSCTPPPQKITVTVTFPFQLISTYVFAGLQTINVQSSATMVILK